MDLLLWECQTRLGPLQFWLGQRSDDSCLSLTLTALQSIVLLAGLITAHHLSALRQGKSQDAPQGLPADHQNAENPPSPH